MIDSEAGERVRLSAEQSTKMLESFSFELVEIRNSFESRLGNSLAGIGDELIEDKKAKLRHSEAEILRLIDRRQRMNKKDYSNACLVQLRHLIEVHRNCDYQATMEMLRAVAQLEEIVGDELVQARVFNFLFYQNIFYDYSLRLCGKTSGSLN